MPRNKRLHIPGAVYHVISRGIERNDIFRDDTDRSEFLSRLETALEKTGCHCLGWVLMSNHFHLLIRTGAQSLSDVMRKVLTGYAIYFNKRHHRHGYLYQNRYKSILCQEDVYLLELIRYIHLNPIRAHILKTVEELDSYPWSGHFTIVGRKKRPWQTIDEVLLLFSKSPKKAIQLYREFIRDGISQGKREEFMGGGLKKSAGGWKGIKELEKNNERWRGDERILGDGSFVERVLKEADEQLETQERLKLDGWNISKVINRVCSHLKIEQTDLFSKKRTAAISQARGIIAFLCYNTLGFNAEQTGKALGITKQAVLKGMKKGEEFCMKNNYKLTS